MTQNQSAAPVQNAQQPKPAPANDYRLIKTTGFYASAAVTDIIRG